MDRDGQGPDMARRLEKNIATQFALAAAILLAVLLLAGFSVGEALESARRVEHGHRMIVGLERLASLVKDAETGQRGYLLTGRTSYLPPYLEAVRSIDRTLAEL